MNKRAQAGLEYLMTYGWALILVAAIIGVLVFIVMPPATSFRCSSSNPNIPIRSYSFPLAGDGCSIAGCYLRFAYQEPGSGFVLQNNTGGDITITNIGYEGSVIWYDTGSYLDDCLRSAVTIYYLNDAEVDGFGDEEPPLLVRAGELMVTHDSTDPTSPRAGYKFSVYKEGYLSHSGPDCASGDISKEEVYRRVTAKAPRDMTLTVTYLDHAGLEKTFDITCNGFPPLST